MQKNKKFLNSLAAVIQNERNAAGNSEKDVHSCSGLFIKASHFFDVLEVR